MEVKIQIPDNCELIKDGDTYIVKEKDNKPRTWEEFCENYPITSEEYFIGYNCFIYEYDPGPRNVEEDRNCCTSEEEAEAFLALMQLRQLRKAWVGDWNPGTEEKYSKIYYSSLNKDFNTGFAIFDNPGPLTFPTEEMAEEFFSYFKDLCETAKILL